MTSTEKACGVLKRFSYPIGLNLTEQWMIERIFLKELARKHLLFLAVVCSSGCTVHAAPQPAPPVTCQVPVTVTITTAEDADERPVSTDKMRTQPPICACTDSTVRLCQ